MQSQHEPSGDCFDLHCFEHHVDEGYAGYVACLECGHVYRSKTELRMVYRFMMREAQKRFDEPLVWGSPNRWGRALLQWVRREIMAGRGASRILASRIFFCPYCGHDF